MVVAWASYSLGFSLRLSHTCVGKQLASISSWECLLPGFPGIPEDPCQVPVAKGCSNIFISPWQLGGLISISVTAWSPYLIGFLQIWDSRTESADKQNDTAFFTLLLNRYFSTSSSLHCAGLLQKRNSLEAVWAIVRQALQTRGYRHLSLKETQRMRENYFSLCNRAWRRSDKADSILELDSLVSLQHLSTQNIFFPSFSSCAQCPPASLCPAPSKGLPSSINSEAA